MAVCGAMAVEDGPVVAKEIYNELLRGDVVNFDYVPCALNAAVRKLRAQGLSPSRWTPYIHTGMQAAKAR
jgi:hypothetical protein